jgi:hypothetical protein
VAEGEHLQPNKAWTKLKLLSAWRLNVLEEADRVEQILNRAQGEGPDADAVRLHLELARNSATGRRPWGRRLAAWVTGADIEAAWGNLHAAKQALVMVAGEEDVRTQIPLLRSKVTRYLEAKTPDRRVYEGWLSANAKRRGLDREQIRAVREAVDRESDLKYANVRRFRNTLLGVLLGVIGLLTVLVFDPPSDTWLPICGPASTGDSGETEEPTTEPTPVQATPAPTPTSAAEETAEGEEASEAVTSCPRVWHVIAAGTIGGLLATVVALRRIRVTGDPYGLRWVQTLLKAPSGALTAVFGTMLLQSELIDALDPQPTPRILVYAAIFGFSQEAVTRFADKKANALLGSGESTGKEEEEEEE